MTNRNVSRRFFILSKDEVLIPIFTENGMIYHTCVPMMPEELQHDALVHPMASFRTQAEKKKWRVLSNSWTANKGIRFQKTPDGWLVKCVAKHTTGRQMTVKFEAQTHVKSKAINIFYDHWNNRIERELQDFGIHTHLYHEVPGEGRYPEVLDLG